MVRLGLYPCLREVVVQTTPSTTITYVVRYMSLRVCRCGAHDYDHISEGARAWGYA